MQMSKLLGERFKEKPGEASLASHIFLLRGGYVRQVANGIYSMLLSAKKIAMKIEHIIREEMNAIDGQEVLFPVVLPAELWKESGRFDSVGSELLRMKDRAGHDMLLGMTHEEAAVHLARSEARTYTKYPFMIYQIQTKFRDEPRSRGGLIRVREFTMKDAYSFHTTQEDLEEYYDICHKAYERIFRRAGLPQVISVRSDTGMMGGKMAHEFMLLCDAGEDTIVICDSCGYRANMEVAVAKLEKNNVEPEEMQMVSTSGIKDIDSLAKFFNVPTSRMLKAAVFSVEGDTTKTVLVFIRGDLQVNESKLKNVIKLEVFPMVDYDNVDLEFGFIGPIGLDYSKVQVIFDSSLQEEENLICGGNKQDYHISGVSITRDVRPKEFFDVAKVNDEAVCTDCGKPLRISRGVEVGNIFQLGTKYTESMDMTYIDQNGEKKNPIMGCYGIGVGRLLACVIEANHDDFGPIWPISIAPWQVHICMLNSQNEQVSAVGQKIYKELSESFDVLIDDRNVAAGIQFADADLLGVPVRVIVSARNLEKGELEIVTRDKSVKTSAKLEDVTAVVGKIIADLFEKCK